LKARPGDFIEPRLAAQLIIDDHLQPGSDLEINISGEMREKVILEFQVSLTEFFIGTLCMLIPIRN